MMKEIAEQNKMHLKICRLKSDIKAEECQKENLETQFRKLQEETLEISSRVKSLAWKIKKAEIIFSCEKKRHRFFQNIMEEARNNDYFEIINPLDHKRLLEIEKSSLVEKLQQLKKDKVCSSPS